MNLRKLLHSRTIASIAHLHSPEDNVRMLAMIRAGQSTAGPFAGPLAVILDLTRRVGPVTLDEARIACGLSARAFERACTGLLDLHHLKWSGGNLVAAPFAMDWGKNTNRLLLAHPREWRSWKVGIAKRSIFCRPIEKNFSGILTPLSTHWVGSVASLSNKSIRKQLGSVASKINVAHAKVGSLTSFERDSIESNCESHLHLASLDAGACASAPACEALPGSGRPVDTIAAINHSDPSAVANRPVKRAIMSDIDLNEDGLQVPVVGNSDTWADDEWSIADFVDRKAALESAPIDTSLPADPAKPARKPAVRSVKKSTRIGDSDPRFQAVWVAHQRVHEKWDENGIAADDGKFGMAGVGSRRQAWSAWQALSEAHKTDAAQLVDETLRWRSAKGWVTQAVYWYLKDRTWTQIPRNLASPSPPALPFPPAKGSAAKQYTDQWQVGVRFWLETGSSIAIPGGRCPSDWAGWSPEMRLKLAAAVRAIGEVKVRSRAGERRVSALEVARERAPAAAAYVEQLGDVGLAVRPEPPAPAAEADPERQAVAAVNELLAEASSRPDSPVDVAAIKNPAAKLRALGASAVIAAAGRANDLPSAVARPRRASMTPEEVAAYCRSVGASIPAPRSTRH